MSQINSPLSQSLLTWMACTLVLTASACMYSPGEREAYFDARRRCVQANPPPEGKAACLSNLEEQKRKRDEELQINPLPRNAIVENLDEIESELGKILPSDELQDFLGLPKEEKITLLIYALADLAPKTEENSGK